MFPTSLFANKKQPVALRFDICLHLNLGIWVFCPTGTWSKMENQNLNIISAATVL